MKWSLVLSSRFNDAEHVITASHTCKIMTCRVYRLLQRAHRHSSWQHHVQWWARLTTHSTDSSIKLHFIKSDVLPHVYFSGFNGTALVNSVTCPRASRPNGVQHSRGMCRVVLQQVRWCAETCPASVLATASCPLQRVQWHSPASRVQTESKFGIQLHDDINWCKLPPASSTVHQQQHASNPAGTRLRQHWRQWEE